MRLLHARTFVLEEFFERSVPPYAILSHTWESDEVSFRDIQDLPSAERKRGFVKIRYCCNQARQDHLEYAWVDTCCIDKSSSAELQEAINSMWKWYSQATVCYVFLADILGSCPMIYDFGLASQQAYRGWDVDQTQEVFDFWKGSFARCKWFTRGWTLQELVAPTYLKFFGTSWNLVGTKSGLANTISIITNIDRSVLDHDSNVTSASIAKRMSWAANRVTTRVEDQAYSLLGIFAVNMPMLYGEGSGAFQRLQEEIMKVSTDLSILAWAGQGTNSRLLASSPADFQGAHNVVQIGRPDLLEMNQRVLRLRCRILASTKFSDLEALAVLNCRFENSVDRMLAIRLRRYAGSQEFHVFASETSDFETLVRSDGPQRLETVNTLDVLSAASAILTITRELETRTNQITISAQVCADMDRSPGGRIMETFPETVWSGRRTPTAFTRITQTPISKAGIRVQWDIDGPQDNFFVMFGFHTDATTSHDSEVESMLSICILKTDGTKFVSLCESWDPCQRGVDCSNSNQSGHSCTNTRRFTSAGIKEGRWLVTAVVRVREILEEMICEVRVTPSYQALLPT